MAVPNYSGFRIKLQLLWRTTSAGGGSSARDDANANITISSEMAARSEARKWQLFSLVKEKKVGEYRGTLVKL